MEYKIEELLKQISELSAELKTAKKYGLVWDKESFDENDIEKCIENIPFLSPEINLSIKKDDRNNLLIEGDNYHALMSLNYILKDSITAIYIDPPYNTGHQDFTYNDNYVNEEDGYRHSKWLSFMSKRLKLARELLKEDGAIFISIDEHEYAQLKLLCDQIFGEKNYVENFIWIKNVTKNLSKTTSTNHEYILCYAKNIFKLSEAGLFKVRKQGLDEVYNLIEDAKKKHKTPKQCEAMLKELYNSSDLFDGISLYKYVDKNYRIYASDNPSAPVAKGTSKNNFDIIHPITKKPCKKTNTGWRFSYERSLEMIANDELIFGDDETKIPRVKRFLDTVQCEIQKSYIVDNIDGKKELQKIFNSNNVFENPKPTTLIKTLLQSFDKNGLYLDFFAGSGTTGQALLELNKNDNGNRTFILCTNNENNICRDVTYPRLKTVIEGFRNDGSKYSDGFPCSLYFFRTDFIRDENNSEQAKYNLVEKVDSLLCIKENVFISREKNSYSSHYENNGKHLFIYNDYYTESKFSEFRQRVLSSDGEKIVYVYSSDNNVDETLFEGTDVILKPIPSKIYEIYKEIVEGIKRGE